MKRWAWNLFWIAVIAVLLYLLLKDIDFYEVYLILTYANFNYILLAFIFTGMTFVVWNIRWSFLFSKVFEGDFWFLLNVLLAGAFFNTITPGAGIGGEPFRAHFLAKRYKKSQTTMLAYVISDKFYQLITLAVFSVFSILFILVYVNISNTLKYILEGALIFVLGFSGITFYLIARKLNFSWGGLAKKLHFLKSLRRRFKHEDHLEKFVNNKISIFARVFRKSVKNKKHMAEAFFLALSFWICTYLTSYFLFLAFKQDVNFLSVIIVVTLGTLVGAFALVPGGIAVTEISMTLLFSAMGIPIAFAFIISLLTRLIYYVYSIPIGAISLWYIRKVTHEEKGKLMEKKSYN
ncbi:flippase-like domain-containing protein [Candidatus Pacearchaeota archaeon]|nr:flippase-like domain-containing protein [Candidatus Pacearchaeota archaeon]